MRSKILSKLIFAFIFLDPPAYPGKKSVSYTFVRVPVFVHLQNADLVSTSPLRHPWTCRPFSANFLSCVVLRSRVLRGVCPHEGYRSATPLATTV